MDKTDTTFLTVTVTVSDWSNRVDKDIRIEAPIEFLNETAVSQSTLMQMVHVALSEYRSKVARRLQAEQLEKMQAEQEGEA